MTDFSFCYTKNEELDAKEVVSCLKNVGYKFDENKVDFNKVIIICLNKDSKKDDVLNSYPWLKDQFFYSSENYLKIMPLFIYHSNDEDIEKLFEDNVGELYEHIFSGEFKPYGWDLDSKNPEIEFDRVLEQYSE